MAVAIPVSPTKTFEASDLAPELTALIDAGMARAVRSKRGGRPAAPAAGAATSVARPGPADPGSRVWSPARGDVALAGLLFVLVVGVWLSVLISLNLFRTAARVPAFCVAQPQTTVNGEPPGLKLCDRLPAQPES